MAGEENITPSENIQNRGLSVELPDSYDTYVDRWAIMIGVSKYKYESLNLKYADRDAEEFYKLLLSPIGGNFRPDHIVKLINHDATTANVTKALRSFLKKPGREDLVIIYCACHGSPDFDRPGNVYLLTHDTDPNDIAGTALPMREIDLSLRENLLSERVVIFADTCHSAAIGGGIGRRGTVNSTALVNRYLKEVSIARGGIALLTSAEATEVSFEDVRWGGGHGVFTHYLLKGMQGEADLNQNGFVTIGELFEYVRAKVQEATEGRQHPAIGTNPYDRNLPLAITFPTAQNLDPATEPRNFLRAEKTNLEIRKVAVEERDRRIALNKTRVAVLAVVVGGIGIVGWMLIRPTPSVTPITTTSPVTPITTTSPVTPIAQPSSKSKLKIYIHLGEVKGRPVPSEEKIMQFLKSEGFLVEGLFPDDQFDIYGPGVDFFHEIDRHSAEQIAKSMNKLLPKGATQLTARLQKGKQTEGTFGIWF